MKERGMTLNIGPRIKQTHLTTNAITVEPMLPIIHEYDNATALQPDNNTTVAPLMTMEQLKAERDQQLAELQSEQEEVEREEKEFFEQWYNPVKH